MISPMLPGSFYERPVQVVARDLLGCRLVRLLDGQRLGGWIVETEAYDGETDLACHARAGLTTRTRVMYGPPGRAYVYFTYGVHWMLNVVTGREGYPAAVLIRALLPCEGLEEMARLRPLPARARPLHYPAPLGREAPAGWTDGPARLCQALAISGAHNGADLGDPDSELRIEKGVSIPASLVVSGARVGIASVPEPWRSKPWRYRVMPK